MSAKCQKLTSRPIEQVLTALSSTADSFQDEAIDDAANRGDVGDVLGIERKSLGHVLRPLGEELNGWTSRRFFGHRQRLQRKLPFPPDADRRRLLGEEGGP